MYAVCILFRLPVLVWVLLGANFVGAHLPGPQLLAFSLAFVCCAT